MISRSFERPDRTVSRASDANNRYKMRYTRTASARIAAGQRPRPSFRHPQAQIADLGLPTLRLEDYEGLPTSAVKVGTYKRSKGLEFKQVFLPRLDLVDLSHQDSTDQANSESQDIPRRSIFVALTRARDRIWLGGVSAQRQADWWTISEPPAVQQGDGR